MRISLNPTPYSPSYVPESTSLSSRSTPQVVDAFVRPEPKLLNLDPSRPVVFTGFDDTKLNSPLKLQEDGLPKSAKYTFAKLARRDGYRVEGNKKSFSAKSLRDAKILVIANALLPVTDGTVPIPQGPGLGATPDTKGLDQYRTWPPKH